MCMLLHLKTIHFPAFLEIKVIFVLFGEPITYEYSFELRWSLLVIERVWIFSFRSQAYKRDNLTNYLQVIIVMTYWACVEILLSNLFGVSFNILFYFLFFPCKLKRMMKDQGQVYYDVADEWSGLTQRRWRIMLKHVLFVWHFHELSVSLSPNIFSEVVCCWLSNAGWAPPPPPSPQILRNRNSITLLVPERANSAIYSQPSQDIPSSSRYPLVSLHIKAMYYELCLWLWPYGPGRRPRSN